MADEQIDEDAEIAAALERTTEDGPGTDDLSSLPESDAEFDAEDDLR